MIGGGRAAITQAPARTRQTVVLPTFHDTSYCEDSTPASRVSPRQTTDSPPTIAIGATGNQHEWMLYRLENLQDCAKRHSAATFLRLGNFPLAR